MNTIIPCSKDLQTLQQFSGQCWSDAAAVFLFFSAGLGPKVQAFLQESDASEQFADWLANPDTKEMILDIYIPKRNELSANGKKTYTLAEEYESGFIPAMKDYIECLRLRYENMARSHEEKDKKIRRRRSCIFSLCKEEAGTIASNLLLPKEQRLESYYGANKPLRERIEEELAKNTNIGIGHLETIGLKNKGYSTSQFSAILEIIIRYLFDNMVESVRSAHLALTRITSFQQMNLLSLNKPIVLRDVSFDESFERIMDTHFVSAEIVITGHAMTLLQCNDGQFYLYDNNRSILKQIDWTPLFKTDIKNTFYIYKYGIVTTEDEIRGRIHKILRAKKAHDVREAINTVNRRYKERRKTRGGQTLTRKQFLRQTRRANRTQRAENENEEIIRKFQLAFRGPDHFTKETDFDREYPYDGSLLQTLFRAKPIIVGFGTGRYEGDVYAITEEGVLTFNYFSDKLFMILKDCFRDVQETNTFSDIISVLLSPLNGQFRHLACVFLSPKQIYTRPSPKAPNQSIPKTLQKTVFPKQNVKQNRIQNISLANKMREYKAALPKGEWDDDD